MQFWGIYCTDYSWNTKYTSKKCFPSDSLTVSRHSKSAYTLFFWIDTFSKQPIDWWTRHFYFRIVTDKIICNAIYIITSITYFIHKPFYLPYNLQGCISNYFCALFCKTRNITDHLGCALVVTGTKLQDSKAFVIQIYSRTFNIRCQKITEKLWFFGGFIFQISVTMDTKVLVFYPERAIEWPHYIWYSVVKICLDFCLFLYITPILHN